MQYHVPGADLCRSNIPPRPSPADYGSATSRAQIYNTPLEISEEEDVIRRNTTPAYRAPEVIL